MSKATTTTWKSDKTEMSLDWTATTDGICATRLRLTKTIKGVDEPLSVDAQGSVSLSFEDLIGWMLRHLSIDALPARLAREGDTLINLLSLSATADPLEAAIVALSAQDRKALRRDVIETARRYQLSSDGSTADILRGMSGHTRARMRLGADWGALIRLLDPIAPIESAEPAAPTA